ncbi:gamma-glutamylcyclotransferase [Dongia sp.]|uniref:gamma-glutamylcyclotransferase n=1 Tax=Dongia sp. TaxID=1977262 RepID=UPI0035B41533
MPPRNDRHMALTADMVACCERFVPEPGPRENFVYFSDTDYARAAADLAAQAGSGPLWIFAYGSLIWKPAFTVAEERHGTALGWHRRFSMKLTRWRGTPEQPGLMLALEPGGSCAGMLLRLPDRGLVDELTLALKREIDGPDDLTYTRWVSVRSGTETVRALTFWAQPKYFHFPQHPTLEETAYLLARACGHIGSGAAYLYNTVRILSEHGIHDRNLWRLQELVAEEIAARSPG